jgi:hypothetical protein
VTTDLAHALGRLPGAALANLPTPLQEALGQPAVVQPAG